MIKLLPCPVCGRSPVRRYRFPQALISFGWYWYECRPRIFSHLKGPYIEKRQSYSSDQGYGGDWGWDNIEAEIADAWNASVLVHLHRKRGNRLPRAIARIKP